MLVDPIDENHFMIRRMQRTETVVTLICQYYRPRLSFNVFGRFRMHTQYLPVYTFNFSCQKSNLLTLPFIKYARDGNTRNTYCILICTKYNVSILKISKYLCCLEQFSSAVNACRSLHLEPETDTIMAAF